MEKADGVDLLDIRFGEKLQEKIQPVYLWLKIFRQALTSPDYTSRLWAIAIASLSFSMIEIFSA
jgi:hypothetical protein